MPADQSLMHFNILVTRTANTTRKRLPNNIQTALTKYWSKTKRDDRHGLISALPFSLLYATKKEISTSNIETAANLGAANLFLWTAANIQDDLCDENSPTSGIFLANTCLHYAWYHLSKITKGVASDHILSSLFEADSANYHEAISPLLIPRRTLAAGMKASFLLASPLILAEKLLWPKNDIARLKMALKSFLSAKQLADDVLDYKEDWEKGRRNFAHRGLVRLPDEKELPAYFKRQALDILKLTSQARRLLKTISVINNGDCLDDYLNPLESNCRLSLTILNRQALQA